MLSELGDAFGPRSRPTGGAPSGLQQSLRSLSRGVPVFGVVGQLLVGWLLADLITGAFHWWEDTHQHLVGAPLIGPFIIAPNILHHTQPLAFTEHGFWARNGASITAAIVAAIGLSAIMGPHVWIASMAVGGALSNEVHRYAHQPSRAPKWYRVLQETGLVQSSKRHAAHHRPPFTANHCILTDWLNPVIEAARKRAKPNGEDAKRLHAKHEHAVPKGCAR